MAELVAAVLRNEPAAPRRSGGIRSAAAGRKGAAARRSALMNKAVSGTASRRMTAPAGRWPGRAITVVPTTTAMTAAVNTAAASVFRDPEWLGPRSWGTARMTAAATAAASGR